MSKSTVDGVFGQWWTEYVRLAYWLARRVVQRRLNRRGIYPASGEIEELAQDAVARGWEKFAKRCWKSLPGKEDRKRWVCTATVRGAYEATRYRSRFGSISDPVAIRDDAMNRFRRVRPAAIHGEDTERDLIDPEYQPMVHAVQQWELRELVDKWLPEGLRDTAVHAAFGITQADSAVLQGVTDRTVRNRLRDIREYLDPSLNIYGILGMALEAARRDTWVPWTTS